MVVAQLSVRNPRHEFDTAGVPNLGAVRGLQTSTVASERNLRACTNTRWRAFESAAVQSNYAVIVVNRLQIRVHDAPAVRTLSLNLALGIGFDGTKEILALDPTLAFVDGLHNRGVDSVIFAVLESNQGLCNVFAERFPGSRMQASIVQLVRQSLACAVLTDRTSIAAALKGIYREANAAAALLRLEAFALGKLGIRYPRIADLWLRQWERIAGYFELPTALRRFLETVDAVGAFQEKLQRQAVSLPTTFKNEDVAAEMLLSLARNCVGGWKVAPKRWMSLTAHCAAIREHLFPFD